MKITGTGAVAAVLLAVLASTLLAFDNTAGTSISNSVLQAKVALPDFKSGYYRGTRFDGSGIILSLLFKGHDYYGPWFTKTSPTVRDFVYEGADIVAGPVHIHDLQATILHCLGVDHTRLTYKFQGRHFRLTDVAGRPIEKLLG